MRNIVSAYAERFLHDRRERLRFGGAVLLPALLVAFIVFWRLTAVGVAMTNEVCCGLEEHTHDKSCYTEVLSCGLEESAESVGHTHDNSCYETVTELVCGLDESSCHIHDDNCFDGDGNLICDLAESEGHTHTDDCYGSSQVLICGLEEGPTAAGHTHDKSCYTQVLTCEIPEHTHSMECLSDETADLETAMDWEATLPEELSGVWAEDVAAVAESQLGYTESAANFRLAEDGETRQGYTRYGKWYGNEYGDWDGMFAAFCLDYAGVEDMPVNAGAYAWTTALEKAGLYSEDTEPAPGDIIFLNTDDDKKADTVAIVTAVEEDTGELTVIQGDHNDAVEEYRISADDNAIVGYGILPDQPGDAHEAMTEASLPAEEAGEPEGVAEEPSSPGEVTDPAIEQETGSETSGEIPVPASEAAGEILEYTAEDGGVAVTVSAPASALPEDAELSVVVFKEESEEYGRSAEAIGLEDLAALSEPAEDGEEGEEFGMIALDICFLADGEEVEPAEPVAVTIDASAVVPIGAGEVTVTHLAETGDGGVEPEIVAVVSGEEPVAEFETESFSNFTITWAWNAGGTGTETVSVSVTAYLDGTELEGIGDRIFTSENDELDFETLLSDVGYGTGDYLFSCAIVTVGNTTYGSRGNPVVAIEVDRGTGGPSASSNFMLVYADGTTNSVSVSGNVSVSAYYLTPEFSVSIEAVDEDETTEAWALQAVLSHAGTYESIIYEWTVTDRDGSTSRYARVTNTDNTGRAYIAWEDGTPYNTEVTVSVTVTLTLEDGSARTATDYYVLEYGAETVDLIMTYGPDKTALPAGIEVTLTSGGGEVYTGTTDPDGAVRGLEIEPGIYTVTADYTDGDGNTYRCSEELAFHDAGIYSVNLNYYNGEILTGVPNRSNWEHIDIKLSVGSASDSDPGSVSVNITGCRVIGSDGTVKYTAAEDSIERNDNEFQLSFYEGESTTGTPSHSIEFDTGDTITITYVLTVNGAEQDPVTITINSGTTYDEGTSYPVTGQRAYKLYNYLYGTDYSSDAQLIADGIGDIDISGLSMMLVAAILCDSSEVTGAGQVQAVDGQSANQWGMDFALSIEAMNELAAGWAFNIEKTYENASMAAGDFVFCLYSATVEDGIWSTGSPEETLTCHTAGLDWDGNSHDTMEGFPIAYSDEAIRNGKTYYYILYEEPDTAAADHADIHYDDIVFGVMVRLGTDKNGEATVTATYYRLEKDGENYTVAETYTSGTGADSRITFDENDYPTFGFTNSYITGVTLRKTDAGGAGLDGAGFTLSCTATIEGEEITCCLDVDGNGTIEWRELKEGETAGIFTLGDIDIGTPPAGVYTLTEISAPAGYDLLPYAIVFEVGEDHLVDGSSVRFGDGSDAVGYVDWDPGSMTMSVVNESSFELPDTGGTGTRVFTAFGLVLIACAGTALAVSTGKKRKKWEESKL